MERGDIIEEHCCCFSLAPQASFKFRAGFGVSLSREVGTAKTESAQPAVRDSLGLVECRYRMRSLSSL